MQKENQPKKEKKINERKLKRLMKKQGIEKHQARSMIRQSKRKFPFALIIVVILAAVIIYLLLR